MRQFIRKFKYGEKGFTLIELLVVVAILGVLAAVAVPNVGKFIGKGKSEAAKTELANIQTAVIAAMADANTGNVSGGSPVDDVTTENFGNTGHDATTPTGTDITVSGAYTVGAYVVGGAGKASGSYGVQVNGTVTQIWYPN